MELVYKYLITLILLFLFRYILRIFIANFYLYIDELKQRLTFISHFSLFYGKNFGYFENLFQHVSTILV